MSKIKICKGCGKLHTQDKCPACKSTKYTETEDESDDLKYELKDKYENNPIKRIVKCKNQT